MSIKALESKTPVNDRAIAQSALAARLLVHQLLLQREGKLGLDAERTPFEHEVGKRTRLHLLHRLVAVNLHRDLAQVQFSRNLLVAQALDDQLHHLALARREARITAAQPVERVISGTPLPVAFERARNRIEHVLIAKRLG